MNDPCNSKGFTLIEIVIALLILAGISVLTAQSMNNSTKIKKQLQVNIDRNAELRAVLKVIEKDIQMAFHYRDINYDVMKSIEESRARAQQNRNNPAANQANANANNTDDNNPAAQQAENQQNPQGPGQQNNVLKEYLEAYREAPDRTLFLGETNKLDFTNLNNIRRGADLRESKLQEVGFFLKDCRSRTDAKKRSQCLWRRSTPLIDTEIEEGGADFVLIEGVKDFKLRYFHSSQRDRWFDRWISSQESSEDFTKNKFPEAVEVKITIEREEKEYTISTVIALAFPNNPPIQNQVPGQQGQSNVNAR